MTDLLKLTGAGLALAAILFFGLPAGCTRPEEAQRVLQAQGYRNVQITGWRPFAASKEDTFSTGFKARSPGGATVTGAVTSSWFKGATIRLD